MGTDREGGKMELDYDSAVKCSRSPRSVSRVIFTLSQVVSISRLILCCASFGEVFVCDEIVQIFSVKGLVTKVNIKIKT